MGGCIGKMSPPVAGKLKTAEVSEIIKREAKTHHRLGPDYFAEELPDAGTYINYSAVGILFVVMIAAVTVVASKTLFRCARRLKPDARAPLLSTDAESWN